MYKIFSVILLITFMNQAQSYLNEIEINYIKLSSKYDNLPYKERKILVQNTFDVFNSLNKFIKCRESLDKLGPTVLNQNINKWKENFNTAITKEFDINATTSKNDFIQFILSMIQKTFSCYKRDICEEMLDKLLAKDNIIIANNSVINLIDHIGNINNSIFSENINPEELFKYLKSLIDHCPYGCYKFSPAKLYSTPEHLKITIKDLINIDIKDLIWNKKNELLTNIIKYIDNGDLLQIRHELRNILLSDDFFNDKNSLILGKEDSRVKEDFHVIFANNFIINLFSTLDDSNSNRDVLYKTICFYYIFDYISCPKEYVSCSPRFIIREAFRSLISNEKNNKFFKGSISDDDMNSNTKKEIFYKKINTNIMEKIKKIYSKLDSYLKIEIIHDMFYQSDANPKNYILSSDDYYCNEYYSNFPLNPIVCQEFFKILNIEEKYGLADYIFKNGSIDELLYFFPNDYFFLARKYFLPFNFDKIKLYSQDIINYFIQDTDLLLNDNELINLSNLHANNSASKENILHFDINAANFKSLFTDSINTEKFDIAYTILTSFAEDIESYQYLNYVTCDSLREIYLDELTSIIRQYAINNNFSKNLKKELDNLETRIRDYLTEISKQNKILEHPEILDYSYYNFIKCDLESKKDALKKEKCASNVIKALLKSEKRPI